MMRFASIILLSAYCLVSLLGHAGFTALRGATLEWVNASHSVHAGARESLDCQYGCPQNHADSAAHEVDGCPSGRPDGCPSGRPDGCPSGCPGGCPDDCVVCHFFSLFKAQISAGCTPRVEFYSLDVQLFVARDIIVAFDYTLRPRPRGPPSLTA